LETSSDVSEKRDVEPSGEELRTERLVAFGRAISDPIRVKMLGMLAAAANGGRGCCGLPNLGAPAEDGDGSVCVCEFTEVYGLGQSKVSYHLGKLKEAGLVKEEKRGRWSFYSLDTGEADALLDEAGAHLGRTAASLR
jgi:ArsR family transcriptional regulator, arsenate/arsenite/antimonite-responsive transcriptional repressor